VVGQTSPVPGAELSTWFQFALHMAVIGFNPVVRVSTRSLPAAELQIAFVLQFPKRRRVAPQAITGEDADRAIVGILHRLLQEDLGRFAITGLR